MNWHPHAWRKSAPIGLTRYFSCERCKLVATAGAAGVFFLVYVGADVPSSERYRWIELQPVAGSLASTMPRRDLRARLGAEPSCVPVAA